MSINLALADAANNCIRENAKATLTLKGSGVQYTGRLDRSNVGDTAQVHTEHGGWVTVVIDEIAAVASHR